MQLVAIGDSGPCKVELSTENITSNPDLYAYNSVSAPLYGLIPVSRNATLALNNSTGFNYSNNTNIAIGDATVRLVNTEGYRSSGTYRGRRVGTNVTNGTGSITITAPSGANYTDAVVTRVVLTYYRRTNNNMSETANTGSITGQTSTTTTWEGEATSVTISMPGRIGNTDSRNVLSNIQVFYTYYDYDEL